MAEKAAHLTPITQIRPSLFDYFAAVSLDSLLYPICQKLAVGLAARRGSFANKSFDELYYLGYSLLQYLYLKSFGATFSEKFYGLKRESLQKETCVQHLKGKELFLSMLTLCLFPYIRHKLNKRAEDLAVEGESHNENRVERRLISIFKVVSALWSGAEIIQSIRYLSGATNLLSISHIISRVKLVYRMDELPNEATYSFTEVIPNIIKVGVFFYQFLQMVPTVTNASGGPTGKLVEPPSQMENFKKSEITEHDGRNLCPLCGQTRRIETVLSTSGYVFCFPCITNYLMKNNHCPITKLPSSLDNLINIYPPT